MFKIILLIMIIVFIIFLLSGIMTAISDTLWWDIPFIISQVLFIASGTIFIMMIIAIPIMLMLME